VQDLPQHATEGKKELTRQEEEITSYRMTLRKREDNRI
jgi:hypothetical protein